MSGGGMTGDEKAVFNCFANCEIGSYMTMYCPQRVILSTRNIADLMRWTKYRARKAIKGLVSLGIIERASCGNPSVESCGEYRELVWEAAPPTNGYALTKKGFQPEEWKKAYSAWCKSLENLANGKTDEAYG